MAEAVAGSTKARGASFFERIRWEWVLIAWTIFLWLSRLRNVLGNEDLSSGGRSVRVGVVVIFVGLALVVGALGLKARLRPGRALTPTGDGSRALAVLLLWTAGYWLVRGFGILIDGEYSVGFKAVHTVLMVVSLTLSGLTAQQARRGR